LIADWRARKEAWRPPCLLPCLPVRFHILIYILLTPSSVSSKYAIIVQIKMLLMGVFIKKITTGILVNISDGMRQQT